MIFLLAVMFMLITVAFFSVNYSSLKVNGRKFELTTAFIFFVLAVTFSIAATVCSILSWTQASSSTKPPSKSSKVNYIKSKSKTSATGSQKVKPEANKI